MEYITTKEASIKWNISLRRVQKLCEQKRILGIKRIGRNWMLPACTEKPADLRCEKKLSQGISSEIESIIELTFLPIPKHNPDSILDNIKDEWAQLQYEAEIAYLRGDFQRTMSCYGKMQCKDAAKLRACLIAVAAAISLGDYSKYMEMENYLKEKVNKGGSDAVFAELSIITAAVSCISPNLVPDWLKVGNIEAVPLQVCYYALYLRAKYFQCIGKYEDMLVLAQTALTLCESKNGLTLTDIYLRMCCVVAYHALEQEDKASIILLETMKIALPHGFITPFAENVTALGGLIEKCILKEFPNYHKAIINQCMQTFRNWTTFHNHFTNDNLTLILTLREYHIAQMVARRVPYEKIAKQQCISVGRVKNIMVEVYGKLFISGREELSKYVF